MLHRTLRPDPTRSCFVFGPRQTGKTTMVRDRLAPADLFLNLLPQRTFLSYAKEPGRFRDEVLDHVRRNPGASIVVDEIQRIPSLLNEVHDLIEAHGIRFVLTGSSARKLRRSGVNLLAGRAWTYHLHPLTEAELGEALQLERALRYGTLPALWDGPALDPWEFLTSYTDTYLREEVAAEGLVRDLAPFARFLDLVAAQDGEVVNFSAFARDCGVSVKAVQGWFELLEDTFLALRVPAWTRSARARLVAHPRFYLFDPGVTNALAGTLRDPLAPTTRGRRFEQLVVTQIAAAADYARSGLSLAFWRTHTGHEVDLLLHRGDRIAAAVEIKSVEHVQRKDLRGMEAFHEEHDGVPRFVLGPVERRRTLPSGVEIHPWRTWIREVLPVV